MSGESVHRVRKLGLRKSMRTEYGEHIQAGPVVRMKGLCRAAGVGLLVQLDPGSHHLACLMGVLWSPRKNPVPSAD